MNKTAIKNYAIWARVQLIEAVKQRAYEYEITENGENKADLDTVGGRLLTQTEKEQRSQLIQAIRRKGYAQVMEEAAYTWFNRFIALRFMEVNGYLPSKVRVFTDETGAFKPEIMKQAMSVELEGLDRGRVLELLDKQNNEALYKYLLITQCNALNAGLPYMFEKLGGWTELLFPANLLRADSVVGQMVSMIPEADWTDAVQIIGWLYQYYNSELNNLVYDGSLSRDRIPKELLPAATTIYTPDWPIRYMVENSLGRIAVSSQLLADSLESEEERQVKEKEIADSFGWKYYLPEAPQEPEVRAQLMANSYRLTAEKLTSLKLIDPCMGSGHILVYAFDVLMQIYTSAGWSERDAAQSILENNLYGLDIDGRAAQLAWFAVMMKARQNDRRILSRGIKPHIYGFRESNHVNPDYLKLFGVLFPLAQKLYDNFLDAMEYGSIIEIKLTPEELAQLRTELDAIQAREYDNFFDSARQAGLTDDFAPLLDLAEALKQKYDVVVTNPPYLGNSRFSQKLDKYVKEHYPDVKTDLSMVMYKRAINGFSRNNGYSAFITTSSWMFLSSFEKLRQYVNSKTISSLVDFGTELFEGKVGHNPIVSWVTWNQHITYKMNAIRLVEYCYARRDEKEPQFFNESNRYSAQQNDFSKIPGSPVAYWLNERFYRLFSDYPSLKEYARARSGAKTANNDLFLRTWWEVSIQKLSVDTTCSNQCKEEQKKWFPHNKGGEFRNWYGNRELVINFEGAGESIREYGKRTGASFDTNAQDVYFHEGITWTALTSAKNSFRYAPTGCVFDSNKGPMSFPKTHSELMYLLALLISVIAVQVFNVLNSSISLQNGDVDKLPVIWDTDKQEMITNTAEKNVQIAKSDWDSFETSWDFERHPLIAVRDNIAFGQFVQTRVRGSNRLSECYREWEAQCERRFHTLKANEEELNRIFIEIYGLQDELTPELEDRDVTVRKANLQGEIKSLISYAVGCMFGRYSVNAEGLQFAGGDWDAWYAANREMLTANGYHVDENNIIPICDDEYFDDDIVGYFVRWVKATYGEETLEENLRFIANALGGKGTPREAIRNYFLNGFYDDHLKIYQKRPIYWLFSSGKKNGFKALIYMHRYQQDLLARMRTDYVHEQQERYRTQLQMLEDAAQTAALSERVKLNRQITRLKDQVLEIRQYEENIHHLADQMIPIDLDDGVKVNYAKFQDVLGKIR